MGGVGRQARVFIWFFVEFFVSSGPRRGADEGVPRPTEVFIEFLSKLFRTSAAFLQFSSPGVLRRAERRADFWCVACLSFFRKLLVRLCAPHWRGVVSCGNALRWVSDDCIGYFGL